MLPLNVTSNLDFLSNIGVLDFDAASYIAGSPPRYAGSPHGIVPPVVYTSMDGKGVPLKDSFNGKYSSTPLWKKVLFGGIVAGGILAGFPGLLRTVKNIKLPSFKNIFSTGKQKLDNTAVKNTRLPSFKNIFSAFEKNRTLIEIRIPSLKDIFSAGKQKLNNAANQIGNSSFIKNLGGKISASWKNLRKRF